MEDWKVTMIAAAIAAFCVIVIVLAIIFSRRSDRKKEEPVGTLHIANDPDDGPYLFLELDRNPEELYSKESVVFYVDNIPYDIMTSNEIRHANNAAPIMERQF